MKDFDIIRLIVVSMPCGMFITYLFFIGITYILKATPISAVVKRLLTIFAVYSVLVCISDLLISIYYTLPDLFDRFHLVYCASVLYIAIVYYHFFCFATQSGKKFRLTHYLWPIPVCAALLAAELFFPDARIWEGSRLSLWISLAFCIFYALLSCYKMYRFQLALSVASGNTSALNNGRALPYILITLLYPFMQLVFQIIFGSDPGIVVSLVIMTCIVLALITNIPLAYAIIIHYADNAFTDSLFFASKGISIASEAPSKPVETEPPKIKRTYRTPREHQKKGKTKGLDRLVFEHYFRKEKPYLNPRLTIYDLVEPLQSNRTYISKFINNTYQMNFASYINLCRLKEMERLQALQDQKKNKKKISQLALQAGFSSYDNYHRAKWQLRDKLNES